MLESVGSKTQLLLSGALGALVLLSALTGVAALAVLERVRTGEQALRARYLERGARLERIRSAIYVSGIFAESYFAAPRNASLGRLQALEVQSTQAALEYGDANLKGEVIAYWRVLNLMSDLAGSREKARLDAYFRKQIEERRTTMLGIADSTTAALEHEFHLGEADIAALYRRFQAILSAAAGRVVVLGVAVSLGTANRLGRAEGQARALSAELVRAQEQERRAIARELHDDIGQTLSGLLLEAGNAARCAALAERAIDSVRRLALSLRPSMLDDLGLVAALEWQARDIGHRTGLDVRVEAAGGAGELPDAQRTCIYRVAQEALQNCARHAEATRVRIRVERADRRVSLEVQDDGKGFVAGRTRGLGLLGMEERVAQLGGRLKVQSGQGRGTTITAELRV